MRKGILCLMIYFFTIVTTNAQVSITGPGGPALEANWGVDYFLTDIGNGIWTANNITLPGGQFKFRLNADWITNWGAISWPSGTATENGPNIPGIAGTYDVTFNQNTGEYNFTGYQAPSTIKLVGSAVINPEGITMKTTDGIIYFVEEVYLLNGSLQFNIDNNLFVGSTSFPNGVANDNVSIPIISGDYNVLINITTSEYSFFATDSCLLPKVKIVGTAVSTDEGIEMTTLDGENYSSKLSNFFTGNAQFNICGNLSGGIDFPSGTAVNSNLISIPVTAGNYVVTLNLSTSIYTFKFPVISITGSAVGGWGVDTDLTTTDGDNYFINNLTVTDGEVKFRQDNNWLINWGDPTSSNGNIVVTAGTYDITFTPSGTYVFGRGTAKGIWTFRDSVTKALVFTNNPALSSKGFNSANFKVFPNPTQNVWNFVSASERIESVKIVDVLGKNVITVSPKANTVSLDATSLTKGIYFAKIATAKATETIKLMKN
jgi:hypothetical protein